MDALHLRRSAAAAAVVCVLALAGCAASTGTPAAAPAPSSYKPARPTLGPFPVSVGVRAGNVQFTLEDVVMQEADAPVAGRHIGGYPGPQPGEQSRARPGYRFASATLVEWDTSIPPTPVWPFTGRKGVVATMTATADGAVVRIVGGSNSSAQKDPSKVWHKVQLEVPEGAREALLYVTPSTETSHVLAFRLW